MGGISTGNRARNWAGISSILFSDIDSLMLYAGIHRQVLGFHRMLSVGRLLPLRRRRRCGRVSGAGLPARSRKDSRGSAEVVSFHSRFSRSQSAALTLGTRGKIACHPEGGSVRAKAGRNAVEGPRGVTGDVAGDFTRSFDCATPVFSPLCSAQDATRMEGSTCSSNQSAHFNCAFFRRYHSRAATIRSSAK